MDVEASHRACTPEAYAAMDERPAIKALLTV
jgi:hypothetical protein